MSDKEPIFTVTLISCSGMVFTTPVYQEAMEHLDEPGFAYEAILKPALYRLGILKHEAVKE